MVTSRPLTNENDQPFIHLYQVVVTDAHGRRRSPVEEFFEGLAATEQADLMARFEKLDGAPFFSQPVWPGMGNWFKNIGTCWELGTDGLVRLYAFRDGDRVVMAVGCKKRGKATPKDEVAKCQELENRFRSDRRGTR